MARNLLVLVAGSSLLISLVGLSAIALLRRNAERTAQAALAVIAEQAAARIGAYLSHQREMLHALAGLVGGIPDPERRLAQVALDAPSLGRVTLLTGRTPADRLPQHLAPTDVAAALAGREVASPPYFREDLTPAMDVCVPSGATPGTAVCATLDLLELQRQVQRIRIGESGFALAFDSDGPCSPRALPSCARRCSPESRSPNRRWPARWRAGGPARPSSAAGWARACWPGGHAFRIRAGRWWSKSPPARLSPPCATP